MKLSWATTFLLICSTGVTSLPTEPQTDLIERTAIPDLEYVDLEKRRGGGGGGGGGRGGGGGSSGGGGGGRSSGSSSGSSRGGSSGRTGSSSRGGNSGGSTSSSNRGSRVSPSYGGGRYDSNTNAQSYRPNYPASYPASYPATHPAISSTKTYGGGRYYAGGASTPFSAGRKSPLGLAPFLLPVAAVAFLLPAAWAYGAYAYPYHHPYHYYNESSHQNSSLPVVCVCQEYNPCGCDDNNNSTYYEDLFNGTQPRNGSNVRVVNVNGTEKIYVNGTLPNDTASGSSGSSENSSDSAKNAASGLLQASGFWIPVALFSIMVWGL